MPKDRKKCEVCNKNLVGLKYTDKKGTKHYRKKCYSCHVTKGRKERKRIKKYPWIKFKKEKCEFCGFIPIHTCQLEVDHKNGKKSDNNKDNLQTLCANCHRLKTYLHKDWGQ